MPKLISEPLATNSLSIMALIAIMLGALSLSALVASPAPARAEIEYPWCAEYNGLDGDNGVNCGFVTLAQCRATISGIGGNCYENPAYSAAPPPPPRRKTRKPR